MGGCPKKCTYRVADVKMDNILAIILSAGEGKRMKSDNSKVLHKVCGKSMIECVRDAIKIAGISNIVAVVGHKKEQVMEKLRDSVKYAVQEMQQGTGHAVKMAQEYITNEDGYVLVLCGDTPLITSETIKNTIQYHKDNNFAVTIISANEENPFGYGRIVRNSNNEVVKIVEQKDATSEEVKIKEVNSGMYCFKTSCLLSALKELNSNNSQGEYYLTDTIEILINKGEKAGAIVVSDNNEILGINNRVQLEKANQIMKKKINEYHMLNGVTFIDSNSAYIEQDVKIGKDTIIYPNTILEGNTTIGEGCIIGPNTKIVSSDIRNNVTVNSSQVLESTINENTKVGPFAYVRPSSVIGQNVKVGDFVEIKKSEIGDNTKISHLTYVGDAKVGKGVNLGCGVVVVNYDGKKKYQTIIGDNSFVGCNVNLISPVEVKSNTFIAAGSTITEEVPENSLAIARARQEIKEDWVLKRENKK